MKYLAHATAALALFAAAGLANAQDATTNPPAAAAPADCPAPGSVPEAQLPDNCKTAAQGEAPATAPAAEQNADAPADPAAKPAEQNADAPADPAAKPAEENTTTVTPDQPPAADTAGVPATSFLASSVIGQTVYSAANENIGEINDLVMDEEKGAVTAILGVGGFLGMGEKNVAMPMEKITATKFEDNTLKLVIDATREELEAAPAFDPAQISMNTSQ